MLRFSDGKGEKEFHKKGLQVQKLFENMDFMLSGNSKREREAKARRDAAKAKRAEEARAAELQAKREEEYEAGRKAKKEEQEKRRLEEEANFAAEQALTGGLTFNLSGLRPYRIEGSEDDKVILPESALVELNQLDVFSKGVVLLRIWSEGVKQSSAITETNDDGTIVNAYTHCGIREFSAPAGTIGVPDKVLMSLLARGHSCDSHAGPTEALDVLRNLSLKYVQLPKVTYAQLQPIQNSFSSVGPVKQCLEENLRQHSTLSVGDTITVWYRGRSHELCVRRMEPVSYGTLLYTDVEVDIDVSQEYTKAHASSSDDDVTAVPPPAAAAAVFQGSGQALETGAPSSSTSTDSAGDAKSEKERIRERRIAALAARGL